MSTLVREFMDKLNYIARVPLKGPIVNILVEEFRPIAIDYSNIRNNSNTPISYEDILTSYQNVVLNSYEEGVSISTSGIEIGLLNDQQFGMYNTDYSEEFSLGDFRWVSAYLNGIRRKYILIDKGQITPKFLEDLVQNNVISSEERDHFVERLNTYYGVSAESLSLLTEGKLFKFSGAILAEPDFFFQDGWDLIHSPEYVAGNIEVSGSYIQRVYSRLQNSGVSEFIIDQLKGMMQK